jgi:hypothetical protein
MDNKRTPKNDPGKQHFWRIWVNAVEIYSREIWKVRNWKREETQDKKVWRRHLKVAKVRFRAVPPKKKKKKKK